MVDYGLGSKFLPEIIDLVMEIILRHTSSANIEGKDGGITLSKLLKEVKMRELEFLNKHPSAIGEFPGKEAIRRIVCEVLVPQGRVEIRIGRVPLRVFTGRTSGGRSWQIVATRASREYEAVVVAALIKLKEYSDRIELLLKAERFDLQKFSEFELLTQELSLLPFSFYLGAHHLSSAVRWQILRDLLPRIRGLFDQMLDIRNNQLKYYEGFDKICSDLSELGRLNVVLGGPSLAAHPDLSQYALYVILQRKVRLSTARGLADRLEKSLDETISIDVEPWSEDMFRAWFKASIYKRTLQRELGITTAE